MLGEFRGRSLSKIAYYLISSTYIIKEIEKLVSCVHGLIMHVGEGWKNTREACKTLVHASILFYTLLSYPANYPRALSHHKRTSLVNEKRVTFVNVITCEPHNEKRVEKKQHYSRCFTAAISLANVTIL